MRCRVIKMVLDRCLRVVMQKKFRMLRTAINNVIAIIRALARTFCNMHFTLDFIRRNARRDFSRTLCARYERASRDMP